MGSQDQSRVYHTVSYFSDGRPVPDLLTEEEAVKFLRLDIDGPKDPSATLKHYRDKKLLRGTRIGRKYRYSRLELLKFIELATIQTDKTLENL